MDITTISLGIIGFLIVLMAIPLISLYQKVRQLSKGKTGASLEEIIIHNGRAVEAINKNLKILEQRISDIEKDSLENIQNAEVLRFNPYKETGGNQSFALALTNKKKNGVVISSLYSRDHLHIFAKPIQNGTSEYTLSNEEKKVLEASYSRKN